MARRKSRRARVSLGDGLAAHQAARASSSAPRRGWDANNRDGAYSGFNRLPRCQEAHRTPAACHASRRRSPGLGSSAQRKFVRQAPCRLSPLRPRSQSRRLARARRPPRLRRARRSQAGLPAGKRTRRAKVVSACHAKSAASIRSRCSVAMNESASAAMRSASRRLATRRIALSWRSSCSSSSAAWASLIVTSDHVRHRCSETRRTVRLQIGAVLGA